MVIRKVHVKAKAAKQPGVVELTLTEDGGYWTYAVDQVTGGDFFLNWREPSPNRATERLVKDFPEDHWELTVIEEA